MAGVTRDLSVREVTFLTTIQPALDTRIEVNVFLPAVSEQKRVIRLRGSGVVVRTSPIVHGAWWVSAEVDFQDCTEDEHVALGISCS